ncbi:MAG: CvpA family protein [Bryobacteraceae bacterium]|nr:CvpA family protein [Bryobacteraceae bacterium]
MNWLDVLLALILGASVFDGAVRGGARLGVSLVSAVAAVVFGLWFYGAAGSFFLEYVASASIAYLLGFVIVFCGTLIAGALVGWGLAKFFKWAGLGWLDRLLGATFGLVRGIVVGIALLLAFIAFAPKSPPQSVVASHIAPYIIDAASVLSAIAPKELKDGFAANYERIKKAWADTIRQGNARRLPTREL